MHISFEKLNCIENRLIVFVKSGQHQNLDLFVPALPCDEENLNEVKIYLIGFNALLKKTAEFSKVPLSDANSLSAKIISKINNLDYISDFSGILKEICISYCELVGRLSNFKYSTPINRAIIKINSNLSDDLSLHTLAKFNNISAAHFSNLFKKETGITLTEYVNTKRIDFAKDLLCTTNLKIKDIAAMCGIGDDNYFIKLFKKYENITPKEFRDNQVKK